MCERGGGSSELVESARNFVGTSLYFGEYLDLPPLTEIVEKAPRMLGVTPAPLEGALRTGFEWYRAQPRRPVDYAFEDRLLASA